MSFVRPVKGGIDLCVWVVPRASRPACGGLHGDHLRVAVTAPPVDGAANEAVRDLIAESLCVPRSQVSVIKGATGRNKTLRILGDPEILLPRAQSLASTAPQEASKNRKSC
jgi:uncharacterized protein (TIGR00251 family)